MEQQQKEMSKTHREEWGYRYHNVHIGFFIDANKKEYEEFVERQYSKEFGDENETA